MFLNLSSNAHSPPSKLICLFFMLMMRDLRHHMPHRCCHSRALRAVICWLQISFINLFFFFNEDPRQAVTDYPFFPFCESYGALQRLKSGETCGELIASVCPSVVLKHQEVVLLGRDFSTSRSEPMPQATCIWNHKRVVSSLS